ncbi:membrane protein [Rhodopirellula sallentina]|uniref:Membrane protein n=1 Tax=Rhodopirellula sallentina SM41 TaxID=1263870 RepID=M5U6B8_9BACT|nr:membrane protein [Rhodopirellula sallentina]EMI53406.1 membrane protein [Rhodopirellula sallentina SM41]
MSVIAIPIVLVIVVALLCLLAGVIAFAIYSYRSRGLFNALAVVITAIAIPALLFVGLAYVRLQSVELEADQNAATLSTTVAGSRSSQHTADDRLAARGLEPVVVSAYPQSRPGQWSSMNHDEFRANLYPSLLEAAEPLAQQTADELKEAEWFTSSENPTRQVVHVVGEPSFRDEQLGFRSAFSKALEQELKDTDVIAIESDAQPKNPADSPNAQPILIRLSADYEQTSRSRPWDPGTMDAPGRVSAVVTSDRGSLETRLRFVDKPWVHNLDQVVSAFPSKKFVVGYSDTLASTEAEARESAIANARSQVDVRTRYGAMVVLDDSHVIDRFAQKLSRPYGNVWREAVLIDLEDLSVNSTAAAANATVSRGESERHSTIFAAVLLILTTMIICLIANFLTQGYHRKSIGWFACLLGAFVVAAVVALNTIA